jgi:hypothetical protein
MTVAEIMPKLQSLTSGEKLRIIEMLAADLMRQEQAPEPLPPGFPPPGDRCPSSREELAQMRSEPGQYALDEVLQSLSSS